MVDAAEEKLVADEVMVAVSKALFLLQDIGSMSDARECSSASQCSCEVSSVLNSASKGKSKSNPPDKAAKRRTRSHSYMGTLLSKMIEDGFTWRKYGQKDIQILVRPSKASIFMRTSFILPRQRIVGEVGTPAIQ